MENKMFNEKKRISVIIPVFNEAENINELHQEIRAVCEANNYEYEIIIINDGSIDKTAEVAKSLKPVKLISFRKNFGQTAALDAGIKAARNNYLVTLDGDRQNDPADIPRLVEYLERNDLDAVSGWRKNRRDKLTKKIASRGADWLRKFLVNDRIHDSGCTLKIYKKECFNNINLYGEMHRFIPALLAVKGFKIGEITVNHRPRLLGQTKYNWQRMIKGLIDLIAVWFWSKYAVRPLHLLGGLGIFVLFLGAVSSIISIFIFLSVGDLSNTLWPLLSSFLLIMGVQLFILGLMADLNSRNYHESNRITPYSIKEFTENK